VLTFGILMNLKGQIGYLIQEDYGIDYSQLGFVLSLFSVSGIVVIFLGGLLIRKLGLRKVLMIGAVITIAGLLWIRLVDSYLLLSAAIIVIGLGVGILNISCNTLASRVFIKDKGRMLNIFHLFFGLGGILAPIYANFILNLGFEWEATYTFGAGLVVYLLVFSFYSRIPPESEETKAGNLSFSDTIKDLRVVIFAFLFFFHAGSEFGVGTWLNIYLKNVQGRSQGEISFYLSVFFAFFTAGRFLASIFVEKIGYVRLVLISATSSIICILLGILGPDSFAIFFSVTGLFIATHFPTIQATMFEMFDSNLSSILGVVLTANSLGGLALGSWAIGYINDLLGVKLGYGLITVYLLVLICLLILLHTKYLAGGNKHGT